MDDDLESVKFFLPNSGENKFLNILYITLAVIIGLILLWIVIVYLTGEDSFVVLESILDHTLHSPIARDETVLPVADAPIAESTLI